MDTMSKVKSRSKPSYECKTLVVLGNFFNWIHTHLKPEVDGAFAKPLPPFQYRLSLNLKLMIFFTGRQRVTFKDSNIVMIESALHWELWDVWVQPQPKWEQSDLKVKKFITNIFHACCHWQQNNDQSLWQPQCWLTFIPKLEKLFCPRMLNGLFWFVCLTLAVIPVQSRQRWVGDLSGMIEDELENGKKKMLFKKRKTVRRKVILNPFGLLLMGKPNTRAKVFWENGHRPQTCVWQYCERVWVIELSDFSLCPPQRWTTGIK